MRRFRRRTLLWPAALLILAVGTCGRRGAPPPSATGEPPGPRTAAHQPAPPATSRPDGTPSARDPAPAAERPHVDTPGPAGHGRTQLRLKVVSVHDGDTLTGIDDGLVQHKIRLDAIDAPELGQPFGQAAKKALSSRVFGREVVVVPKTQDKYGRTIGHVLVDGRDVNLEMLEAGMAWHYEQYDDTPRLRDAQRSAREAGRGLWQGPDPEPPWDHRREQRQGRRSAAGK